MEQEIEAKFRLDDPGAISARLQACGARRVAQVLETNRMFDTAERKLLAADCGLRLRTCRRLDGDERASSTLTYKGPRAAGEVKVREEIETTVGDPSSIATILQRLGFNEVIIYEKRRETWQLDDCEVCLDELPRLGWFVEIEGPSPAAIQRVCHRLALSDRTAVRETYVELAAKRGAPRKEKCVCLEFTP